MQRAKEIILGGGPAGLIWAFYHPESIVITDKVGGQFSAPFQLGPKYLHHTPDTVKLLTDLGVIDKYEKKTIKVGYIYDHLIHGSSSNENRMAYFNKTRGINTKEPYRSSMSGGSETFEAFDIGVEDLVRLLEEKVKDRIVIDKITAVNVSDKCLYGENDSYSYENLISTIPRKIFCYLVGDEEEAARYQSHPTTFVQVQNGVLNLVTDFIKSCRRFDYVYNSDYDTAWHRLTNLPDGTFCLEFKGDNAPEQLTEINRVVMKIGQLIHLEDQKEYPNVRFFGRYAQNKHGIKTNELLRQIFSETSV